MAADQLALTPDQALLRVVMRQREEATNAAAHLEVQLAMALQRCADLEAPAQASPAEESAAEVEAREQRSWTEEPKTEEPKHG